MAPTKLTAQLVVDLTDKTGRPVQAIIGNLDRLKRAEREVALAERGVSLSRKDRAVENLMVARKQSVDERKRMIGELAARGSVAAIAIGVGAAKAYSDFAGAERRVNRIVINADKGLDAVKPTMQGIQAIAKTTHMSIDDVTDGLETLVASGRSLDQSMSFLPAIAITAQASGSAMKDIALSADSLAGALQISGGQMQKAFDELVTGGKLGKFELQDMSRYLPSIIPAFAALGYRGTDGLAKLVAMLQVVRNETGTSEEAATNFSNILQKMYSQETAQKFKKLGIDLPASLDKAKKNGKDVLSVFLKIANEAVHGDLSKLPTLFQDAEVQKGVRALLDQPQLISSYGKQILDAQGTALNDFNQIAADSQAKIQDLETAWVTFEQHVGRGISQVVTPVLNRMNQSMSDKDALQIGFNKLNIGDDNDRNVAEQYYKAAFNKVYPNKGPEGYKASFTEDVKRVGRGEEDGLTSRLDRIAANIALYVDGHPKPSVGRVNYQEPEFPGGDRHLNPYHLPLHAVPIPLDRPPPETPDQRLEREQGRTGHYPSHGTYGDYSSDEVQDYQQRQQYKEEHPTQKPPHSGYAGPFEVLREFFGGQRRTTDNIPGKAADDQLDTWPDRKAEIERLRAAERRWWAQAIAPKGLMPAPRGPSLPPLPVIGPPTIPAVDAAPFRPPVTPPDIGANVSGALEIDQARAARQFGFGGSAENLPGKAADDVRAGQPKAGPQSVTISGTPTVTITNPPLRPNVTVNVSMPVTIQQAADPEGFAAGARSRVEDQMQGILADTNYMTGQ